MGIRPHLVAIIGVDNLQTDPDDPFKVMDPRGERYQVLGRKGGLWEHKWFDQPVEQTLAGTEADGVDKWYADSQECRRQGKDGEPGERVAYSDLFVYDPEFGLPGVVGVKPPYHLTEPSLSMYDDGVLWLLSGAMGWNDSRVLVIPQATPDNNERVARLREVLERKPELADDKDWTRHWEVQVLLGKTRSFPHFGPYKWDHDFKLAHLILKRLGFDFDESELKLMLYWYWS